MAAARTFPYKGYPSQGGHRSCPIPPRGGANGLRTTGLAKALWLPGMGTVLLGCPFHSTESLERPPGYESQQDRTNQLAGELSSWELLGQVG